MRHWFSSELSAIAVAASAIFAGCTSPCYLANRTLIREPARYSHRLDGKRSLKLYRSWAESEWGQVVSSCGEIAMTADYHAGFVDGFVDYVFAGGTGEPPPVPPRSYWNVAARSPQGKEMVEQWFNGFRHGARVAHDGGYREAGTIQTSLVKGLEDTARDMTLPATYEEQPSNPIETLPAPVATDRAKEQLVPDAHSIQPSPPTTDKKPTNPFREDDTPAPDTNVPTKEKPSARRPVDDRQEIGAGTQLEDLELPKETQSLPVLPSDLTSRIRHAVDQSAPVAANVQIDPRASIRTPIQSPVSSASSDVAAASDPDTEPPARQSTAAGTSLQPGTTLRFHAITESSGTFNKSDSPVERLTRGSLPENRVLVSKGVDDWKASGGTPPKRSNDESGSVVPAAATVTFITSGDAHQSNRSLDQPELVETSR